MDINYQKKYLKYKQKYLQLSKKISKDFKGGSTPSYDSGSGLGSASRYAKPVSRSASGLGSATPGYVSSSGFGPSSGSGLGSGAAPPLNFSQTLDMVEKLKTRQESVKSKIKEHENTLKSIQAKMTEIDGEENANSVKTTEIQAGKADNVSDINKKEEECNAITKKITELKAASVALSSEINNARHKVEQAAKDTRDAVEAANVEGKSMDLNSARKKKLSLMKLHSLLSLLSPLTSPYSLSGGGNKEIRQLGGLNSIAKAEEDLITVNTIIENQVKKQTQCKRDLNQLEATKAELIKNANENKKVGVEIQKNKDIEKEKKSAIETRIDELQDISNEITKLINGVNTDMQNLNAANKLRYKEDLTEKRELKRQLKNKEAELEQTKERVETAQRDMDKHDDEVDTSVERALLEKAKNALRDIENRMQNIDNMDYDASPSSRSFTSTSSLTPV